MNNEQQGNESNAHVVILDQDGATVFNGRRTVRNVLNNGFVKSGKAIVNGVEYIVAHRDWKWTGTTYISGLK
jgi:hypothetical protein